jgi:1-deoxy-D-xylulose-5-phosphate reductoisomerase
VTPREYLAHPTHRIWASWSPPTRRPREQGAPVIEARYLSTTYDRIDVTVHPQSIVHSCIRGFVDGSTVVLTTEHACRSRSNRLAEPLPGRAPRGYREHLDSTRSLSTPKCFPAVDLAKQAGRGGTYPL